MTEDDGWTEWDDGPVARPYTVTGGRTRTSGVLHFDLIDVVGRTVRLPGPAAFNPERSAILRMCEIPLTVADLASGIGLPLQLVRVLLDDLVREGLIEVRITAPRGRVTDHQLLERVLAGIRAL
jgi:hypothetical protein